jgi:hypothetical protein
VITECRDALTSGAIVTIEEVRYRLRRLLVEPSTREEVSLHTYETVGEAHQAGVLPTLLQPGQAASRA